MRINATGEFGLVLLDFSDIYATG